ncbi:MAG: marine proteobacterial sortase target protein [Hyphomicrobiales bacterium]|nr:MAG: marine proteobacterial sortase target protein [Hyphomicrobiales bacterium]
MSSFAAISATDPETRPLIRPITVLNALAVLAGLLLAALMAAPLRAGAEPARAPRLVALSQVNYGALLLQAGPQGKYVEAPLVASDIDIKITGIIARAVITQRFRNPAKGWAEGKYVFPLPDNAAVDTLKMMIGKRFIEGRLKERREAKIIYEKAKAAGKKAALVEQERPNMFTNSVANIGPGETVVVQLEYQHEIRQDGGEYRMRVPLVVAPRYLPKPVMHLAAHRPGEMTVAISDPVPDAGRISPPVQHPAKGKRNPVSMNIHLAPGFALGEIKSPHHKIAVRREGSDAALIGLADGEVWAERDFELTWTARPGAAPDATLFRETVDGQTYLLAMINPPAMTDGQPLKPREMVFVIDNSGSMSGQSMRQAREGLLYALSRLKPADSFNIIRFDDTMDQLFADAVAANDANLTKARAFVAGLEANGGTEMLPALKAALIDARPGDTGRLRQVIFLTDGAIGNESQLFAAIQAGLGRSRIFTVGIGSAPNSFFMSRAATYGRGSFTHIGQTSEVKTRMAALVRKLEQPAMTDLRVNWPGSADPESWPNPLPDLYAGEPIVLTARMDKLAGDMELSGDLAGRPWSLKLALGSAESGTGIARLWARRKIMALEGIRYQTRDWKAHDAALLAIALKYGLVSRLTSLVAVDVTPSRPKGAELISADVPLNLPAGWNFEKVFGEDLPAIDEEISPTSIREAALIKTTDTPPVAANQKPKGLPLPAGATEADLQIMVGLIALMMAALLLLMLVLRRRGFGPADERRPA